MADNIKAYAQLENLFDNGNNLTNFQEIELEKAEINDDGEYVFVKTIDVPFTSWHYQNHEFSVNVKAVNENNNTSDNKDREDYSSGSDLNGLFRAVEKDLPKFQSPTTFQDFYTSVVNEIEIVADDNNQSEWYKNSGINSLELKIFKNDETNNDLFDSSFLTSPSIENGVYTWYYRPTNGFDDGAWKLEFIITDNDENSKSLIKEFTVDTKAPQLTPDGIDNILDSRIQYIKGLTDPNIDVEITIELQGTDKTTIVTGKSDNTGRFNIEVELYEGYNTITIKVIEPSGLFTTAVISNVLVDTSAPQIVSVTTAPIKTEVGSNKLQITVKVRL